MKLKLITILPLFAVLAACGEQAPSPDTDPSSTNSIEGTDNIEAVPAAPDGSLKMDDSIN